jgi:hypothetical protein
MPRRGRLVLASLLWLWIAAGCDDDPSTTCGDAISGVVLQWDGAPVADAQVEVTGAPAVRTGTDGAFTICGVVPPYDITLHTGAVQVWRGLTRRDPVLHAIITTIYRLEYAGISGQIPMSVDQFAQVAFDSPEARHSTRADPLNGHYSMAPILWAEGRPNPAGKLFVLRGTVDAGGIPLQYDGWSVEDLALSPGTSVVRDFVSTELVDPAEDTIRGRVTIAPGFELDDFQVELVSDARAMTILRDPRVVDSSGDFEITVPVVASTSFRIYARARPQPGGNLEFCQTTVADLLPGAEDVEVVLESPPLLQTPPADATNVNAATTFEWTPGRGPGVYVYVLRSPDSPDVRVYQAGTTLRFTDLHVSLPPGGTDCEWSVLQVESLTTVDRAAAAGLPDLLFGQFDEAGSEKRPFRTGP